MKILVLGVGNILFGDEGIGVHLCNYLKVNYKFSSPHQLDLIDGGTLAQSLIPMITDYDEVLILDCVSVDGAKVGEVYHFPFSKVPNVVTWAGSAHEVEMLHTLRLIEVMGDLPPVYIVGIVPYVIGEDTTFVLTDELLEGAKLMEEVVIDFLKKRDVSCVRVQDLPLQTIANHSYRGVDDLCI
ncbi:HyaD/HybD family hydrogenase maturation endopeptidase [Helicobacter mustelae]|uniref:Putative hydrogenase maturation protease n=1 Tax=Helicobacter mustelae (strain ATCC 43772 / CCUG 25715 / CIP 103759 / LMG 18044 / NCTC 12198 / R85-136P) TaxID=679897 RepID=D3UIC2_HELM1|nr:HyaD/HybD family hydrogenase maturation endopeptidase [Helicobacter mustelae]CBG40245.1 putative hydrogenase maturation protease [Helicobacter mustelae 12198]SQH71744.1 hydrogenase maturation protease [Helicobacter mustelae]STP12873.1 hydrogenase maturation protease [Helicobacter mustelae]